LNTINEIKEPSESSETDESYESYDESEYSSDSDDYSDTSSSDDNYIDSKNVLDLEGSVLENYNILCKLGEGAYSIVWLGYYIGTGKYYAIKVQHSEDYKDGLEENKFMKKLDTNLKVLNHLTRDFVEIKDNKKYLCSVYDLHACNLDHLLRKGKFKDGFPVNVALSILKQLLEGLYYLHNKLKTFHGDFKTDNILLKGVNTRIKHIMKLYDEANFNKIYFETKSQLNKKKIDNKLKLRIRKEIHYKIYTNLIQNNEELLNEIEPYDIDVKYINDCRISLADFGSFVSIAEYEYYDKAFGTRYYRSPENILVGKSSYPNDIWALGCTFYELLTGRILYDPDKDSKYSRDDYHLKLINESCGRFSKDFLKTVELKRDYFDSNYQLRFQKDLGYKEKIERKLNLILDDDHYKICYRLLKGMLMINPKERLTAKQCLEILKQEYFNK